ncbi:helix-turn-helix domain-containing protein [Sphingobacterium thalpophilum]|uniref:Helix-turn-helix domain-containing protein n=1 Tax=Sphingobacterium thalpophilum TaxID=259 RepID=A0ACD5C394_9SPHI
MMNSKDLEIGLQDFGICTLAEFQQTESDIASDTYYIIKINEPIVIAVNREFYTLDSGQLLFVGPRKRIKFMKDAPIGGYVLSFTAAFYLRSKSDVKMLNSILFYGIQNAIQIEGKMGNQAYFDGAIIERIKMARVQGPEILDLVAHHCVESILMEGHYRLSLQGILSKLCSSSEQIVFNSFNILVYKYYRESTSVSFYANKLKLTSRRLSALCAANSEKSAKAFISGIVVQEAIRLIRHSNLSILQISFEIGFSNVANFRNFIKKHTGKQPHLYRNERDQ